eukprot:TRINITY_DN3738_c0_g1_i3.p1 TRINITY_DN3738_c0_g1~~TRINITY_DN3738_c0_g1_i3.p1  ORF type:complete len:344 (-),score=83.99 TRINITY_DN3738_c0_g1_i3:106-1137(-)
MTTKARPQQDDLNHHNHLHLDHRLEQPFMFATPSSDTLHDLGSMHVRSPAAQHQFSQILHPNKTCVVFVRHAFCSFCCDYIRALIEVLPPADLEAHNVGLVIISCGHPSLIKHYKRITGCPYPMFCDPSTSLYSALDMKKSLLNPIGPPADYIKTSLGRSVINALALSIKAGPKRALQGGTSAQLGGEMILGKGGVSCEYIRRQAHARAHTEPRDLRRILFGEFDDHSIPRCLSPVSSCSSSSSSSSSSSRSPAASGGGHHSAESTFSSSVEDFLLCDASISGVDDDDDDDDMYDDSKKKYNSPSSRDLFSNKSSSSSSSTSSSIWRPSRKHDHTHKRKSVHF